MSEPVEHAELAELARTYFDRRTAVTVVSTVNSKGFPETAVLAATRFNGDGSVAGGEEEGAAGHTFRNLRQNPVASLLVLDPITDPRSRDGVRVHVEFLGAESDGEELQKLDSWLQGYAPGRRIVRRLLFKVLAIERYRSAAAVLTSDPS